MTDTIHLQYHGWGIDVVSAYLPGKNFGPIVAHYAYPVGTRGPVDDPATERKAIEHCLSLSGKVKGPFFYST